MVPNQINMVKIVHAGVFPSTMALENQNTTTDKHFLGKPFSVSAQRLASCLRSPFKEGSLRFAETLQKTFFSVASLQMEITSRSEGVRSCASDMF